MGHLLGVGHYVSALVPFTRKNPGGNHARLAGNLMLGRTTGHAPLGEICNIVKTLVTSHFFLSVTLKLILLLKLNYKLIGSLNTGCTFHSLERHNPDCICSATIGEGRV